MRSGWFKTGDIGDLDDDGYLRITGRKKELIVTAAGKNVAPAPLEDRIRAHPLISQAVVVGDARPFVAALITIDEEAFETWATQAALDGTAISQAWDHPALLSEVQAAIDEANQSVSRAESIRKFAVLPHDLTVAERRADADAQGAARGRGEGLRPRHRRPLQQLSRRRRPFRQCGGHDVRVTPDL